MSTIIYIDAKNGLDTTGDGSKLFPYQTLQYFCDNVASKADADYEIFLQSGTYEITNSTIFGQFISGNITIIGKGKSTEIIQKIGMYSNSVGGNANFTLTIAKCKYNIDVNLTNSNLMDFLWKWNFYNVLFEYTPNNGYAVLLPYTSLVLRNCVKLTNTTNFLRATDGTIEVIDSIGYFTSGYATSQGHWDKGGNTIGSVENYNDFLNQGLYAWSVKKSLILHDGEYKKVNQETPLHWEVISSTIPTLSKFLEQGMDNFSPLLDHKVIELEPIPMKDKSEILDDDETGKVFSKTIDLKKYFDIRSMKVEVK